MVWCGPTSPRSHIVDLGFVHGFPNERCYAFRDLPCPSCKSWESNESYGREIRKVVESWTPAIFYFMHYHIMHEKKNRWRLNRLQFFDLAPEKKRDSDPDAKVWTPASRCYPPYLGVILGNKKRTIFETYWLQLSFWSRFIALVDVETLALVRRGPRSRRHP